MVRPVTERSHRGLQRRIAARIDELAAHEQSPCGGVDEQRRASADVRAPVAAADLVADQPVARGGIGNAQQRFGEAHQRDAFARVEREFQHQRVDAAGRAARCAYALRERRGKALGRGQRLRRQCSFRQQRLDRCGFVDAIRGGDSRGQHRRRTVGCC